MTIALRTEFEQRLLRFISEQLLDAGTTVDAETRLFEDGHIDSMRVLDLLAFVESTLGRPVPTEAVRLSNFGSVRQIAARFVGGDGSDPVEVAEPIFERRTDRSPFLTTRAVVDAGGGIIDTAPGRLMLAGRALALRRAFDALFLDWARELGAQELEAPSLISLATLSRAGYVASFPQLLTLASHLEPSLDVLRRAAARPDALDRTALADGASEALAPAACYHCYPLFAERRLTAGDTRTLTVRGRCFRHEGDDADEPERMRDFTMREIVLLGDRRSVEDRRMALIDRMRELVGLLDLDAVIVPASDPFFTADRDGRRALQRVGALKYELRLAVGGRDKSVAAASFNHHRDHFGKAFDIRLEDGRIAHSGCVAFGLERWVLAFLAQHGVDASGWPEPVREWLAREEHHATA